MTLHGTSLPGLLNSLCTHHTARAPEGESARHPTVAAATILPEFRPLFDIDGHAGGIREGFNILQAHILCRSTSQEPDMPSQPGSIDLFTQHRPAADRRQRHSIRDRLESDAWKNHRKFAEQRAEKHASRLRRRPLKWQDRALLVLSAILLLLLIIRVETAQAQEDDWGLQFQGNGGSLRSLAMDTDMQVEVNGLVARISVSQQFRNTGRSWSEAIYRFPLPDGSAVDRMTVEVGQRILEGEIRETQEARRQYQQAKSAGKVATLVEQQRANQFETRLANIGPDEKIRVSISFLSRVEFRDGSFSLRIPMTFTPRWDHRDPVIMSGFFDETTPAPTIMPVGGLDDHYLTLNIDLQTGMSLATLESRYHDVNIQPSLNGYNIFLADPDARSDRMFELNWTPDFGDAPESTLMTFDDGDAVYALLMLAPPLAEAISPQAREVVFVVDTSGSMEGTSIRQAKAALRQGLGYLGPDDRFNLIHFNSNSYLLFPESVPLYTSYLLEAESFIEKLVANGGTNMAPALDTALNLPPQAGLMRQVVFITDGSVGNEGELLLQIGEELNGSRLFPVSIGSAPNAWFMRKAAEIGRGSHTHIGRLEEVEERMSLLWSRIQNPALKDICVDWGMDAEFYPGIVPDLYAGEPLWLHARLPFYPSEVIVCGELEGLPWQQSSRILPGTGSDSLATLWARSKVEALEDGRIFGDDPELIRDEVTRLALHFGLLTPYTSLVAVDRTPSRPQDESLDSEVIPSLLPAGSSAMSAGFSQTATGWVAQLILAFISLLVATGMFLFSPPSGTWRSGGARSPMATTGQSA
jgi:Ca-activated chloride channel family protein